MATISEALAIASSQHRAGRLDLAAEIYRRILAAEPDNYQAWNNLGNAWKDLARIDEAIGCYRRALECRPDLVEVYNNLASALENQGKLDEAAAAYEQALRLKPDFAEIHSNLGNVLRSQGKTEESLARYLRALELKPELAATRSMYLCALQYRDGVALEQLARAHADFDRRHAALLRASWARHENRREPDRRLRLGFVSPDLGRHPVGSFLLRAVENLDRAQCEIVCYCDRPRTDDMTGRFQRSAALWRDIYGLPDEDLCRQIRSDGIDILFDLAGHTSIPNRMLAFARRPAPVQATWIGYEGTTGLEAIDYLLADRHLVPPEAERFYAERILRLPDSYVCLEPPYPAPAVGPLPALATGRVTLGSFNNPAKITPRVVDVWSRVLGRIPQAKLLVKYRGADSRANRERLEQGFAARGIGPERLELEGQSDYLDYLAAYNRVDLALDPFPFNGGMTTCDALWMGAPVVTWPGETFAGRHSLGFLLTVGLTETIAGDPDDYVRIAGELAGNLPRLAGIRAGLRRRMAESPLCDGRRFADNLMHLLRGAWREWTQSPAQ